MPKRTGIRNQLIRAWEQTVRSDYCSGHINSERSLQASLFANLRTVLKEDDVQRHVFIEPTLKVSDGNIVRPDIMVCNAREAICFLELKYVPRGKVDTSKDMRSLTSIARSTDMSVSLERYRGPKLPPMSFKISKTVLFAWAGIHCGEPEPAEAWSDPAFREHFHLELHAVTSEGQQPRLHYHTDARRVSPEDLDLVEA